jgi:hypothetical protein
MTSSPIVDTSMISDTTANPRCSQASKTSPSIASVSKNIRSLAGAGTTVALLPGVKSNNPEAVHLT